jgi:UDP-glucose:tetrahydrobiopterin glucosyltransferase
VRVALVAPLVTPIREPHCGGAQAFIADLARGLTRRGHAVDLYAASGSRVADVEVIDVGVDHRELAATFFRSSGGDAAGSASAEKAFAIVYGALGGARYDVIHNHAFDAPAITLASGLAAPVVHTLHLPPQPLLAAAVREAAEHGASVACVSAHQAGEWASIVHVDAILAPYVPTASIPFGAGGGAGAVFAGRLSAEKGAAEAIEIAKEVELPLDLFGDSYDPDYAQRRIDPHRGEVGISIHGAVSREALWDAMGRAAVVLCPARWEEPFGMVAAEAQACGTPVVAFRRGALGEVIDHGVTGLLVEGDDIAGAAAAVRASRVLRRGACREHAERRLDLELSLDAHERLYSQLARRGAPVGG